MNLSESPQLLRFYDSPHLYTTFKCMQNALVLSSLQTQKLVTHAKLFLIFRKHTFSLYYHRGIYYFSHSTLVSLQGKRNAFLFPSLNAGPRRLFEEDPGKKRSMSSLFTVQNSIHSTTNYNITLLHPSSHHLSALTGITGLTTVSPR